MSDPVANAPLRAKFPGTQLARHEFEEAFDAGDEETDTFEDSSAGAETRMPILVADFS